MVGVLQWVRRCAHAGASWRAKASARSFLCDRPCSGKPSSCTTKRSSRWYGTCGHSGQRGGVGRVALTRTEPWAAAIGTNCRRVALLLELLVGKLLHATFMAESPPPPTTRKGGRLCHVTSNPQTVGPYVLWMERGVAWEGVYKEVCRCRVGGESVKGPPTDRNPARASHPLTRAAWVSTNQVEWRRRSQVATPARRPPHRHDRARRLCPAGHPGASGAQRRQKQLPHMAGGARSGSAGHHHFPAAGPPHPPGGIALGRWVRRWRSGRATGRAWSPAALGGSACPRRSVDNVAVESVGCGQGGVTGAPPTGGIPFGPSVAFPYGRRQRVALVW